MPSRARRGPGTEPRSVPSKEFRPPAVGRMPVTLLSVVVLPAPLRPTRPTSPPAGTSSVMFRKMTNPRIVTWSPSTHSMSNVAEHGLAHLGIGQHLVGRAVGDHPARVEDEDAPAIALDDLHVVLHEDGGDVALLENAHERVHDLELVLDAHATGGLVHEQELRLEGEGEGDVQELAATLRQLVDLAPGVRCEAEALEDVVRLVEPLPPVERLPEGGAPAGLGRQGEEEALQHSQARVELRDLERSGDAQLGDRARREPRAVLAQEEEPSVVGAHVAGDDVEEGGLSGPVGPYDPDQLPAPELDVHAIGRPNRAERLGQIERGQDRVSHRAPRSAVARTWPRAPRKSPTARPGG